jgi:hypothetical protein
MWLKISSALIAAFVIGLLAVSLGATGATAAGHDRHAARGVHRVNSAYSWHHRHRFARRGPPPVYGFVAPVPYPLLSEPGYVFVPGRGILGESCNMPTSTCTNEYRDVQ